MGNGQWNIKHSICLIILFIYGLDQNRLLISECIKGVKIVRMYVEKFGVADDGCRDRTGVNGERKTLLCMHKPFTSIKKYRISKYTLILNGSFACPKRSSLFLLSFAYIRHTWINESTFAHSLWAYKCCIFAITSCLWTWIQKINYTRKKNWKRKKNLAKYEKNVANKIC